MFFFPNVPVSKAIEVDKSHVVATNCWHGLAFLCNLTLEEILSVFAAHVSELKGGFNVVDLIFVDHFANQLMAHGAHHNIVNQIVIVIQFNWLPIFEFQQFVAIWCNCGWVHARFGSISGPPS